MRIYQPSLCAASIPIEPAMHGQRQAYARNFSGQNLVILRGHNRQVAHENNPIRRQRNLAAKLATSTGLVPMGAEGLSCVLLADRHHGLSEGVRGLLEAEFAVVVMVADVTSLIEGARRMKPSLAVADLSLSRADSLKWISDMRNDNPSLRVIGLSVHDEPSVCRAAIEAGVDGFVLKRDIALELLESVTAVAEGRRYVSRGVLKKLTSAEKTALKL